uniref:Pancreatic trypsin inhibitor n=1 Tax=Rhipicephalus zambeziensis TaxID=60191 RepID=A0A224Y854_9ACAR
MIQRNISERTVPASRGGMMIFVMAAILALSGTGFSAKRKVVNDQRCHRSIIIATGMCIQNGTDKAPQKRWGYNSSMEKCVQYYYSACQGNENNFATPKECLEACRPKSHCLKTPERPVLQLAKSWYFDANATECKQRKISFPQKTSLKKNRFKTKDDCISHCMPSTTIDYYSYAGK